ncbi:MAG: hypothetical protein WD426_00835 [Anditalea sp.]
MSSDPKIGIAIIESLNEDVDKKTGTEIYNDALKLNMLKYDNLFSEFFTPNSKADFFETLELIKNSLEQGKFIPVIHIESHGSEEGISLSNGELVTWKELFVHTTEINILLKNKLILILGLCSGNAIISAINPDGRSPFGIVIGVYNEIKQIELINALSEFYGNYLVAAKIDESIKLMNKHIENSKSHFHLITCIECFNSITNPDYNRPAFDLLMNRLAVERKSSNKKYEKVEFNEIKSNIESFIREKFKETRSTKAFFMMEDVEEKFIV